MSPATVAIAGLAFTIFAFMCGAIVGGFKITFTLGKMANRLDNVEGRPVGDGDCAKQLGIMNERLTGMEALFEEKINGIRDLVHEGLKPKPHLRTVAPKERASARS